jgi:hypothetical protein
MFITNCDYVVSPLSKKCLLNGRFSCDDKNYCNKHIRIVNSDKEVCCVCLDNIHQKDWKLLHCKHHLHKKCFEQLMNRYILKCPMCRTYLGRDIVINEQFKIHINEHTYTYNMEDVFNRESLKKIRKRTRKHRPRYIFKELIRVALDQYIFSNDDEDTNEEEYMDIVNEWVRAIECRFEVTPFISTPFCFTHFPFSFKKQIYMHEKEVLNIIIRLYLTTI